MHLDFYGDHYGEAFVDLLDALQDESLANSVRSLIIRGPDTGANGTRNWDLSSLANSPVSFSRLTHLSIERTKPTDHNRSIVAPIYEEEGLLGKLLAKALQLLVIETPSTPNEEFFRLQNHPLECLSVDTGYDHQGFVANLARSSCFPNLRFFEFGEYQETYMDDFSTHVTPIQDYRTLLQSSAFASVRYFRWFNPVCTPAELAELRAMRKDCQISVLRWTLE